MKPNDELKQQRNFEDAVAELVDQYLKEGIDPDFVRAVLDNELKTDLFVRQSELDAAPS